MIPGIDISSLFGAAGDRAATDRAGLLRIFALDAAARAGVRGA
ncbi:MAG TPA: hypothetical protein VFN46_07985 [Acetobacteraceae bacterium]|nr:hypothetical protein [Acetobacteraceae bacterium]